MNLHAHVIEVEVEGRKVRGVFVQTGDNQDINIVSWALNRLLEERQQFVNGLIEAHHDDGQSLRGERFVKVSDSDDDEQTKATS